MLSQPTPLVIDAMRVPMKCDDTRIVHPHLIGEIMDAPANDLKRIAHLTMKTGSAGRRRAGIAAAQHEGVGAFPVPASRVLSAVTDCEEHRENPGHDYADHVVKAHVNSRRSMALPPLVAHTT
jgi:hypothetical protein